MTFRKTLSKSMIVLLLLLAGLILFLQWQEIGEALGRALYHLLPG